MSNTEEKDVSQYYDILDFFSDDKNLIIYRPILRQFCGSVTASILFSQLIYWFKRYPEGFFKNIQQNNPDSWCNELGFSYKEFTTAFDKVGLRHKSKTIFKELENPFVKDNIEYMFCCYVDRMNYLVYFFWNPNLIRTNLCNLTKVNYCNLPKSNTVIDQSEITCNLPKVNQIKGNNRLIKETNKRVKKPNGFSNPNIKLFQQQWIENYPGKYVVSSYPKWGKQLQNLLKAVEPIYNGQAYEKLIECMQMYFKSKKKWHVESNYSFDVFMLDINAFVNEKLVKKEKLLYNPNAQPWENG